MFRDGLVKWTVRPVWAVALTASAAPTGTNASTDAATAVTTPPRSFSMARIVRPAPVSGAPECFGARGIGVLVRRSAARQGVGRAGRQRRVATERRGSIQRFGCPSDRTHGFASAHRCRRRMRLIRMGVITARFGQRRRFGMNRVGLRR